MPSRRSLVSIATSCLGVLCALALTAAPAAAQERLCDASWENCRTPLLDLINNERVGIDVGVWFFKDDRYVQALVRAQQRGVPIRILMDTRANATYPTNATELDKLKNAGIPMRRRIAGDILHWKLMIFAGQGVVEWSGANFSPTAFVPYDPYKNYEDEVIYYSKRLLPSFETMFDNIWTNTKDYTNYANVSGPLTRNYATFPIDPRLNFPPKDSYQDRLVPLIDREPRGGLIDVDMYRITMARPVDAIIRAAARGVRVRMYLEPNEYTNTARPGNKVQMDRLVAAAKQYPGTIEIRMRAHEGLNHQKTVWLHAQHIVVFGTSNWSDASDDNQLEANIFTDKAINDGLNDLLFTELNNIFVRKFYNRAPNGAVETVAWRTPELPPPANPDLCPDPKALNYGGPAPCEYSGGGGGGGGGTITAGPGTVSLWTSAIAAADRHGSWQMLTDSTASGASALWNPDAGQAKVSPALASPSNYFETTFTASAGTPYHLWLRMRSQNNAYSNDSVHVQFSDSVTSSGSATMRLGTTSSAEVVLQAGDSGAQPQGWGWADNGWNTPGVNIYFSTTGTHTVRVQQREDGAIIDEIVLSSDTFLSSAPGPRRNDTTFVAANGSAGGTGGGGGGGGTVPAPWTDQDIGAVGPAGDANFANGTFTVTASGSDVWGTADAFHFVYQPWSGDGSIVARVASLTNTYAWAKAGVMFRESLAAGSEHAFMLVSPGRGAAFQRRTSTNGASVSTSGSASAPPRWMRLDRAGNTFSAYESADGSSWTLVGTDTISMPAQIYVGLAVASHDNAQLTTSAIDHVTVSASGGGGSVLPSPWADQDVGGVGPAGSAGYANGTFTVRASGADVWGTSDAFHFVYQPWTGDGSIVARVASLTNTYAWAKSGVMFRESLAAGSTHAFMLVSPGRGVAFQRRTTAGGASATTAGTLSAPPRWVRLDRAGDTFTAYESSDGTAWTLVGSDTIAMASQIYVGLAVTSHDNAQLTTSAIDGVAVSATPPGGAAALPSPWADKDIGSIGAAGGAEYAGGVFTVRGSGADVWGTSDAFHYVYEPLAGDGWIRARVDSVTNVDRWSKAGVMIRETLSADSAQAFMLVSVSKGVAFQRRQATGGDSVNTAGSLSAPPRWVGLQRTGDIITAFESADGTSWIQVGTDTIPMAQTVYMGLAVTSHDNTQTATARISQVTTGG